MTDPIAESEPIAWRVVTYGTPVAAAEGTVVGTVREVLGSDSEDVFHGLRVSLTGGTRNVLLSSTDVTLLTAGRIESSLPAAGFERLPDYAEEATYHLASVGWLRKHAGWVKDSAKDEEPG